MTLSLSINTEIPFLNFNDLFCLTGIDEALNMDLSVEFRPALGVKRESSVSPPGWDHSSEGDRPLDFSRQSPSATNEKVANDADSSPAKKCAVSEPEQDSPRTMPDQRKLLLTNPQQLRFHDMHCPTSPPQSLSPNFQAIMGLAPNVLQSNEDHLNLYESLVLKSLQSGSSPQHIFDPGYLHFRNQVSIAAIGALLSSRLYSVS